MALHAGSPVDYVARTLAETALATAEAGGGTIYDSQAAGEAGTTDGEYFTVSASGVLTVYERTAGGSTALYSPLTIASLPIGFAADPSSAKATIDQTVTGSWAFSSYGTSYINEIGVNNAKPVDEPATGSRTADSSYISGGADVAAIIAGYDNVNNALAGMIASQHSMLYTGADHASIWGGSLNTIKDDTDYSVILGGTSCTIQERGRYAAILASDTCQLVTGASDAASGFRGLIATCSSTTISGRNSAAIGCVSVTLAGTYSTVLNGSTVTVGSSTVGVLVSGSNHTVGNSAAASYSLILGDGHSVNGSRNVILGDGHTSVYEYALATGTKCVVPFHGARVHASRHRSNTAGNNMALDWQCSQETTDTTTTRLSTYGSSSYPTQPANSVVTGTVWVTGVKDDGTSSAFKLDFSSVMGASGAPTIKGLAATVLHDDLALPTDPTIVSTSTGIYRVQVVGLAATNIRWNARFVGHQVVWG